ncbi:oligosaccharide flippase family protein [Pedobacter sp. LMG 31464]|uniref:Oligosaccharide flippase family protein n=1 Tax=Pedobacter planticolens TaxID=2679964 RepID=A0A923E0C1_9SPHI|nr:oligosaccharide flippase family protein [Pedobacter planticolens]MBB2145925.1 oligosaccharide flippase family protein [Pedobacter planticolens]
MPEKKAIFGKKEIVFTAVRYFIYGLQTARGFILAYYLGPYFLGIYGYLMLYQQYLSYTNLGINYSVNSELAVLNENGTEERNKIINSAFTGIFFISAIIIFIGVIGYFFKISLFPVNQSYNYIKILIPLTILINFQQIFVNIFRIDKKLKPIIIGELILSLGLLTTVLFFKGIYLINAVFYLWVLLLIIINVFYLLIYGKRISFNTTRIKLLFKSGLPLLIYAFSYYLMSLMVRTLIGAFYPVEVMGYFSFANNITTAIMLGVDTITWIIFPSIIAKLGDIAIGQEELKSYLISFTNKLVILVLCIVTLSILFLPILFYILPKYKPVEFSLVILLTNQIIFNSGFAFVSLCIARKMHKQMALISLLSVVVSTIFCVVFCYYKLSYIWLVVSNVIGSLCFINLLIYFISKNFKLQHIDLIKSFDWILQLLFCSIVMASVFQHYLLVLLFLMGIMLYKLSSFKELYIQFIGIYFKRTN